MIGRCHRSDYTTPTYVTVPGIVTDDGRFIPLGDPIVHLGVPTPRPVTRQPTAGHWRTAADAPAVSKPRPRPVPTGGRVDRTPRARTARRHGRPTPPTRYDVAADVAAWHAGTLTIGTDGRNGR